MHRANSSRGRTTLSVQVSALAALCISLPDFFLDEWVWCKHGYAIPPLSVFLDRQIRRAEREWDVPCLIGALIDT